MRIIAGTLKNRKLIDTSKIKGLRPTTDKNRQALFNILFSAKFLQEIDFSLQDASVLDLCCGTGAVAFEALSRGAKNAFLIDKNSEHLAIAKKNAQNFALEKQTEFSCQDCTKLNLRDKKFGLIFIDPPYEMKAQEIVDAVINQNLMAKNSLLIVESARSFAEINFADLRLLDSRQYGLSHFTFFALR